MEVSASENEFLIAAQVGSRELVQLIEEKLEFVQSQEILRILNENPFFLHNDIVVFADLSLLMGDRELAFREYANWSVTQVYAGTPQDDLFPLARTSAYGGVRLRAKIAEVTREPFPDDLLGRFVSRSASASLGDWPVCLTCSNDDLRLASPVQGQFLASRMMGLGVLAHLNMLLYKEASTIIAEPSFKPMRWSITDGRYQGFHEVVDEVAGHLRQYVELLERSAEREAVAERIEPGRRDFSKIRLDQVDIFIKTYPGDQAWLEWCLKSVKRFAHGFRQVVIVSDAGHGFQDTVLSNSKYIEIATPPEHAPHGAQPGYLTQQIAKLCWHTYTDADAVMMLDSDTILRREVSPTDFLRDGRPVWYYGTWDTQGGKKWRPGSEIVIGRDPPFSYMREHPFFLSRDATRGFHAHVERRFGKGIADVYFDENIPAVISEFECFGAFLGCVDPSGYVLEEIIVPRGFVVQHWSWGGLDAETEARLEALLAVEATSNQPEMNDSKLEATEEAAVQYKNMSIEERSRLDPLGEMELFRAAELWDGGYLDSDPLEPVGWSSYSTTGFVSVYHATYLACIKPYVSAKTVAMEIGPGRGAWTKAILSRGAERVYALDVQARETNVIDSVLGDLVSKLDYIVVTDFSGQGVPDDAIDFFWSFGTFVHLSRGQQKAYYETIARKMKSGGIGFVQYADIPTWNRVVTNPAYHVHNVLAARLTPNNAEQMRDLLAASPVIAPRETVADHIADYEVPDPGRYFYVGTDWVVETLKSVGLEVVDRSVFESLRDPVISFRKP